MAQTVLSHVEDDNMSVEMRRRVAVDGPGCVVLEGRRNPFAGCLGGIVAAEPGLYVFLSRI